MSEENYESIQDNIYRIAALEQKVRDLERRIEDLEREQRHQQYRRVLG